MSTPHMSISDIANELKISKSLAHKLVTAIPPKIRAINVGSESKAFWRVPREEFNRYLREQQEASARRFGDAS